MGTSVIFEEVEPSPDTSLILINSLDPKSRAIIILLASLSFHLQVIIPCAWETERNESSVVAGFFLGDALAKSPSLDRSHLISAIINFMKTLQARQGLRF